MSQFVTHLLATDLDGTLVGDKEALHGLFAYYDRLPYRVVLVYITGRHKASALELMQKERLPMPDVLITDVGTEIYSGPDFVPDEGWQHHMEASWKAEQLAGIASQCQELMPQNVPAAYRLSYTVWNQHPVCKLEEQLQAAGIPHKLIVSSGRDVDILPPNGGKGEALRYVLASRGWEQAQVLVAGDSGNDHEMIMLGYPAVIVGNAQPELTQVAAHPSVFHAKRVCAGGIQEAWEYFYGGIITDKRTKISTK
ncbi:sucrose-phosphate synthase/hypothetical protein [Aneurinibacillus soli]|uniref:Mannosylfructose-phosphate phosphatase n=1 Tax=Aneurinibacillus soli TaxID=1500254 RepID=A0A0U5B0D8_9BACL|nr:HAD-IIB family hydrolase [Aneurinibacillus soli]PYE59849.1 sucrose-phosphate synthase/hypothetical protein [Aneurinibacillus soli]BAU29429.1 Mannosylfructose-phosphate phosphatase [Aneurinibacillus soli]